MNRKQSAWLLAGLARDEGTVVVLDAVDLDDPNLHAEVAADWRIGRRLLAMADDEAVLLEVEPWAILRRYRYRGD